MGIALTGFSGNGTWQYSLDGGTNYLDVPALDTGLANPGLLLRSVDLLRYVPDFENGEMVSITYHAWDQSGSTAGQHGTQASATPRIESAPRPASYSTPPIVP